MKVRSFATRNSFAPSVGAFTNIRTSIDDTTGGPWSAFRHGSVLSTCFRRHPGMVLPHAGRFSLVPLGAGFMDFSDLTAEGPNLPSLCSPTNMYISDATTEFEPILNVPALVSFLIVAVIFGSLFVRINSISEAIDRRTLAITELRKIKSKALAGQAASQKTKGGQQSEDNERLIQEAVENYRTAYEEVERLRTVIPGILIAPAPPQSSSSGPTTGSIEDENTAAARQFLGIEPLDSKPISDRASQRNQSQNNRNENVADSPLSIALLGLLGLVAASQLILLGLLMLDPMTTGSTSDSLFNTIDSITGLE